jgi:hypothetical protein
VQIAQICGVLAESAVVVGLDFRNREKEQLGIGFTGVARFVSMKAGRLSSPCVSFLTPQVTNCRVSAAVSSA